MTAFNPRVAARILEEGPLRRLEREHRKLIGEFYKRMYEGQPTWHRTMHELESLADAAFDRYWSLKEHIAWLYAESTDRLADLGMSR
ncbi:hypothetical protein SEA_ERENYEAGER_31 [Microbacterium phage Erenyeager]|nr:hypothetical protein SEA_ERENYEAGER_31 [Microbacterium phage Erenyeager]